VQARLAAGAAAGVVRGLGRLARVQGQRGGAARVRLVAAALALAVRERLLLGVELGAAALEAQLRAVARDVLRIYIYI